MALLPPSKSQVKGDFCVCNNGEQVLLRYDKQLYITSTTTEKLEVARGQRVLVNELLVRIDPRSEWREVFNDAWRIARDTFWDKAMGGVDWDATYVRYSQLLPRVGGAPCELCRTGMCGAKQPVAGMSGK